MKNSLIKCYVTIFVEGKMNFFLSFDFFLLCPCTTEHWLAYHWWYANQQFEKPWSITNSFLMLSLEFF
jgi:hypothetical protein